MIVYHRGDQFGNTVETKFDADTMESDHVQAGLVILKKNTSEVARVCMQAGEWMAFESALSTSA
jgi:hypothetical protein